MFFNTDICIPLHFIKNIFAVRKSYFLLFLCFSFEIKTSFAQTKTLDNLRNTLPFLKGSARIDCLNELGFEYSNPYWSISKYTQTDTAFYYTQMAQKEAVQFQYKPGIAKAYQNIGMIEEERGDFSKSKYFTGLAIHLMENENMPAELHRAHINLGFCMYNTGYFDEAINIYKKELPYYQSLPDTIHLAMIYRMIGRALNSQGQSEMAFQYYQKDFNIQKKSGDILGILYSPEAKGELYMSAGDTANAITYFRQSVLPAKLQHMRLDYYYFYESNIFILQKKYDSSLYCLKKNAAYIHSSINDSIFRIRSSMLNDLNQSDTYLLLKENNLAISKSREPIKAFTKGGDIINLMHALKNMATAYLAKSNNTKALLYANRFLEMAEKTGARPNIRDAYYLLWRIFESQKKIAPAYEYCKKYISLKNSLDNDNYLSKISAWDAIKKMNDEEANYNFKLGVNEERSNAKMVIINKEKKIQLGIFISAITIFLILAGSFGYNFNLKRRKDKLQNLMTEANLKWEKQKRVNEIAELNQQKTEIEVQALRAQMNPHFIFNSLNSINHFIISKNASLASDYLTKFAKLIRMVLQQSGKSFIALEDELNYLRLYMDLEALRFEIPFKYEIHCIGFEKESVMIPTLIIQPFIENAIWHGLHSNEKPDGRIKIDLSLHDDRLHCEISDNGVGRIKAFISTENNDNRKKSLGITLTKRRLHLLAPLEEEESGITITDLKNEFGENAGTVIHIEIPVKKI